MFLCWNNRARQRAEKILIFVAPKSPKSHFLNSRLFKILFFKLASGKNLINSNDLELVVLEKIFLENVSLKKTLQYSSCPFLLLLFRLNLFSLALLIFHDFSLTHFLLVS